MLARSLINSRQLQIVVLALGHTGTLAHVACLAGRLSAPCQWGSSAGRYAARRPRE